MPAGFQIGLSVIGVFAELLGPSLCMYSSKHLITYHAL